MSPPVGTDPSKDVPAPRSLRLRLVAIAATLVLVSLVGSGWLVTRGLSDFIGERYRTELNEDLLALVGAVRGDEQGRLVLSMPPSDPRYLRPLSGWYWQIGFSGVPILSSPSLAGAELGETGPAGERLLVLSRSVPTPDFDEPMEVSVAAPRAEIEAAAAEASRPLAIAFAVLGIGLVAAIALQVHLGLAPLRRLASDLRRVRDGEQPGLPPQRYDEIRPLSEEINALLDANRTVVQRARGHLADLSHALKTPLSVVRNVLDRQEGDGGSGLRAAELMERLIERRLGRARAQARPHNSAALAGAVIDDIVLVVSPLARRRGVFVETNVAEIARFAGDRDDLAEMIGPLAENACAHAGSRVVLAAWREDSTLVVTVEDDGPGMTETEVRRAIERGERLDETHSGSGLGLSIAQDIARLYGGTLALSRSDLGGLLARLDLPAPPLRNS